MFLIILFTIILTIILIIKTIKIKIIFDNTKIQFSKLEKSILNKESKIFLKIYIFNKIKIFEINILKIKIDKKKMRERINKIREKQKYEKLKSIITNILKKELFSIETMNLIIYEGTEDAAITAIGVGIISAITGNILKNKIKNPNLQKFQIIPLYENDNYFKIEFNGILNIKYKNIKNIIKNTYAYKN